MTRSLRLTSAGLALAMLAVPGAALAKPAHCFTTDDGNFPCDFRGTNGDGSFEISAPGKPSYRLTIDAPGQAQVSGNFGTGRWVPLPGPYIRSNEDGACWNSSGTETQLCAW